MDYKKIHDKLVKYCRETTPLERLKKRNLQDKRLGEKSLYVEIHHITPRSLGGTDNKINLVELLPEEHLFIHMIRYKIYGEREDILAVRFMLNGFSENKGKNVSRVLTKKLRMGYAWIRHQAAGLRRTNGWQTDDGKRRISEARKGTMPVKDAITGEKIGSVSINHQNVLNGTWVHHSKGKKLSENEILRMKESFGGQGNPNASGLTEEYFLETGKKLAKEFGRILSWAETVVLSEERGFKWIKSLKSRFNGKGTAGYYSDLEKATGLKYDSWATRRVKND